MTPRFAYDSRVDPPAPILPVRVSVPGSAEGILLAALVDSGADLTLIPEGVAAAAGLPSVDEVRVRGVGGATQSALLHAAEVRAAGAVEVIEVVALGDQALLGRNLLNRWVLTLDGPEELLEIAGA